MKIAVSLPAELVAFADREAKRRGISRSGLLAELLKAERSRGLLCAYLDRFGWETGEDNETWRGYQRRRMAEEYGGDEW